MPKKRKKKRKNKQKRNNEKQYVYMIDGTDETFVSNMSPHEFKKLREIIQEEEREAKWWWLLAVIIFGYLIHTIVSAEWNIWLKTIAIIVALILTPILTNITSNLLKGLYHLESLAIVASCMFLFWGITWFGPLSSQSIWLKIALTIVSLFVSAKISEILTPIKPEEEFVTSIPKDIQKRVQNIINDFNQKHFSREDIAYVATFIDDGVFLDRIEKKKTESIARLGFQGKIDNWEFAIYKYLKDDYDPDDMFFPGSEHVDGTIQGAMKAGLLAYPLRGQ